MTSQTLPLPKLEDLADTRIAQKISQLPGVGLVSISGGQRPAVRIQVNPKALAAYGLSLDDVRTSIAAANTNQAKGSFDGPTRASTIDANDQLKSADEYRQLIIAYRNGAPVRVQDVALAVDAAENSRLAAWANTTPAVILNVQRQPGTNVIEVVDRVKNLLPQLQASLPAAVEVTLLTDRTVTIRASVRDVEFELLLAVALVVMVIYLFLRNVPATLIPSVAVPLSLVGTFGVMYLRRVLDQQPDADGAHHRDRLRRRRRDRRHREHRTLHRGWRVAAGRGAQGHAADRVHDHLADVLADRRVDPTAVHGRRGRPAVPRVRDHAGRVDPHFRGRVADADADDVRQAARATRLPRNKAGSTGGAATSSSA